jgi:hypothetical protein
VGKAKFKPLFQDSDVHGRSGARSAAGAAVEIVPVAVGFRLPIPDNFDRS